MRREGCTGHAPGPASSVVTMISDLVEDLGVNDDDTGRLDGVGGQLLRPRDAANRTSQLGFALRMANEAR